MQNFEILVYSIMQGITVSLFLFQALRIFTLLNFFEWKVEGLIYVLAAHLGTLWLFYYLKKTIYLIIKKLFLKNELDKNVEGCNICWHIYSY